MIFHSMPVGPLETNCLIFGDEASGLCAIVDPGAEGGRILAEAKSRGLTPAMILLTHGHWDHTGAVAEILKVYPQLPVYIHPLDLQENAVSAAHSYAGAGENQRTYRDGDILEVGNLEFHVLNTPGHSQGSTVLLCGNIMAAGDTLFASSCGRCDFPGGSLEIMFRSLRRLAALEGDYIVWPGHGPDTTLSCERVTNPYVRQALMQK